jgi:hypothetical protein
MLGLYAAFYLAAIGVVHFLTSPEAAAAFAPETGTTHAVATTTPVGTVRTTGDTPAPRQAGPETGAGDD